MADWHKGECVVRVTFKISDTRVCLYSRKTIY